MNQELLGCYIEDLKDNLILLDEAIIMLRQGVRDRDIINSIFRVAHTIKGNSAAMEFVRIEQVMHTLEDILQKIRNGSQELNEAVIDVLFTGHDFLEDCMALVTRDGSDQAVITDQILEQLELVKIQPNGSKEQLTDAKGLPSWPEEIIEVVASKCARGYNAYELVVTLAAGNPMLAVTAWMVYEQVEQYAELIYSDPPRPDEESFRLSGYEFPSLTIRLLLIVESTIDDLQIAVANISDVASVEPYPLIDCCQAITPSLSLASPLSEAVSTLVITSQEDSVLPPEMEAGTGGQKERDTPASDQLSLLVSPAKQSDPQAEKLPLKAENVFVRVPTVKVDSLMDMLGEMLILNSQLEVSANQVWGHDSAMLNVLSRNAKLIKSIQSLSMSLRMVEMRSTLHRLTRIARDTAAELGKKVVVSLEGENTEIDRSAAERIFDPLMHLIRNAVSHGIEDEIDRIRAGKSPEGQMKIRCYSKRGNVYIEVADDGRGMDPRSILARARALQIADPGRDYTEEEILRFIMAAGFSTQVQINSISGRGVGMNIVQEEVTRAGGKVDIVNLPGQGCTFILRIPMNLAVVNGTIVKMAGGRYIIPTLFIKEFYIAEVADWISMQGRIKAVKIRNQVLPVLWPQNLLGFPDRPMRKKRSEMVVMELEQKLLALPVERIVSRQEVVAKPLISELSSVGYASGASILGDGSVALILDVEAMFSLASGRSPL